MNMNNKEKNSYVREHILKTLIDLMKNEEFESITIYRLVAEAGVGRSSFYRNYDSKEDVLQQEAKRLKSELNLICKSDDPNNIRLKLLRTLDFFQQNSDFYCTLYQTGFKQIIEDSIIDMNEQMIDLPNLTAYTISGFSYLIYGWMIEWIKRGMQESSNELIEMFDKNQNK